MGDCVSWQTSVIMAKDRAAAKLRGQEAARYVEEEFSLEKVTKEFYKHIN